MMKRIEHPNIIQLYDSFIDRQFDTHALKKRIAQSSGNTYGEQNGGGARHDHSFASGGATPDLRKYNSSAIDETKPNGMSLYIAMEYAEQGDMQ